MKVKNIFGAILLIIGIYLLFNLYQSLSPVIHGTQVKANIIGIDSVKSKRFTFLYYPVLQFSHKNSIVTLTDKGNSVSKNVVNTDITVYYDEDEGISRGFTIDKIIFSVISILLILFGILSITYSK